MRAIVKSLNRICARADSFRSPLIRRLVVSACGVLRECVSEIESYDPESLAREHRFAEPDVETVASRDAEDAAGRPQPPASTRYEHRPLPGIRLVKTEADALGPERLPDPKPTKKKRIFSDQARANISAWATRVHTCPHCQATGRGPFMFKGHFNRCPMRPAEVPA